MRPDVPVHDRPGPENGPPEAPEAKDFKVPAGASPTGALVQAHHARPAVAYRCPGCGSPLVLKRGEVRSPHFAHKSHAFCSPETSLHLGVKNWIAKMLKRRPRGLRVGVPKLRVPCAGIHGARGYGHAKECPGRAWLHLADLDFDEVAVERGTLDALRPDVLLLHHGEPVLGIEVLVTHAVDEGKAARCSHPWIEVDAMQVLRSPRAWKPCQGRHPWTGACPLCMCASTILASQVQDCSDPGDFVAEVSAAYFETWMRTWLHSVSRRIRPAVFWRCPWCRKRNKRLLQRELLEGVAQGSSLIPPCDPEVILEAAAGLPISITFGFPHDPRRPRQVALLRDNPRPFLRVTPNPKQPHRLEMNGTNRPLGFLCPRCGQDCIGVMPSPMLPVPWWESVAISL
jgi:hypothetical protein